MFRNLIEIIAAALIVAGVAAVYWPASLVVAGGLGLLASRPRPVKQAEGE